MLEAAEVHSRYNDLDPDLLQAIQRVASLSEFFADYLQQDEAAELTSSGDLLRSYETPKSVPLIETSTVISVEAFDANLRSFRNREMARIIFRDLTRAADLVETTRDLSHLADTCLETALSFHHERAAKKFGNPIGVDHKPQQLCVLALGKLGAMELNLSSDIDLVFFYETPGETDGDTSITNTEFFVRVARQLINSLDKVTANGFVFRVDMRLRPYGESGALVLPRSAMEKYFLEQGREWERYAFIKARPAAGDIAAGIDFLSWLKPFVYRKHLDYGAIESLREMKQLINKEVQRQELEADVKLGAGGIREVEFIVQAQQLIWGGNKPELQKTRLLDVLSLLEADNYLPKLDTEQLRAAYIFLRNSEHAIQAEKDKQTQQLPATELGLMRLASAMGFESVDEYMRALDKHRANVIRCFADLMNANQSEQEILVEGKLFWVSIWRDPDNAESQALLQTNGFDEPEQAARLLNMIRDDLDGLQEIGVDRLNRLMPALLGLVGREEFPTLTLERLVPVVLAIVRRSTYLAFLNENLDALQRLIRLCAISPWIASQMEKLPILLYELTDFEVELGISNKQALSDQLDAQLIRVDADDLEAQMDVLRTFKHAFVLKLAMLELLDLLPTMRASDGLTEVAEVVLNKAVDIASRYLIERHGEPTDKQGTPEGVRFAVIAYGKLGGIELGYGSDLDVVFLHDGDSAGETNGEKPIHNNVFYSRLGQRVVHILTSLTRFGTLYELDLRLRPDGNSGPLVVSVSAFKKYLLEAAWTWEHQALVRARFVAGSAVCESKFLEIRRDVLSIERDLDDLTRDVKEMRQKMRVHLDKETLPDGADDVLMSGFDLKQGAGAIVDIEFLVQYLVLGYSAKYPRLTDWTDKVRLLATLGELGLLTKEEAAILHNAYISYRSAVHFTWLGGEMGSYEKLQHFRESVVAIWHRYLGE